MKFTIFECQHYFTRDAGTPSKQLHTDMKKSTKICCVLYRVARIVQCMLTLLRQFHIHLYISINRAKIRCDFLTPNTFGRIPIHGQ